MRRSVLARSGCFHFSPALKRELSLRRKTFPLLGYFCQSFVNRSEEHTSELQSQSNLVCRLLLEKKKKKIKHIITKLVNINYQKVVEVMICSRAINIIAITVKTAIAYHSKDICMLLLDRLCL